MSYPFQICCRERLTNIVTYHPFLQIYVNLENRPFTSSSDILDDIQRLLRQVIQMRARVTELSKSIANLRDSEAIRKVTAIGNWDDYFCNTRRQLEEELEQLERM